MNEAIAFAEWIAENHFQLFNVESATNTHYWYNENSVLTTEALWEAFKENNK